MEFYSLQFILFLVFWLIIYYSVRRRVCGRQWVILLAASLSFYAIVSVKSLAFILITAWTTWQAARTLERLSEEGKAARKACTDKAEKAAVKRQYLRKRRVVLWCCLILNFGILAILKYCGGLLVGHGLSGLVIPLGISFYTFQSVSYLVDIYNGKYASAASFLQYLTFVSWFPQLLQGPINRYDAMGDALTQDHAWDAERAYKALLLILCGLLKKYAIAEQLSPLISAMFDTVDAQIPGSVVVCGILMYSAQQYADFSGGIDVVLGVSELFGIPMAQNFRQPYFATSLGDFWRRWHISLGAWMRDYVFYPVALTRPMQRLGKWCGKTFQGETGKHLSRTAAACIANLIVFLLVGVWHGAEEHYIAWGLYNGLIIALSDLTAPLWQRVGRTIRITGDGHGMRIFRIVRTFIIVNIGWYFDRISDLSYRMICFRNTVSAFRLSALKSTLYSYNVDYVMKPIGIAIIGLVVVFIISVCRERQIDVRERVCRMPSVIQAAALSVACVLILFSFVFTAPSGGFLYAQF